METIGVLIVSFLVAQATAGILECNQVYTYKNTKNWGNLRNYLITALVNTDPEAYSQVQNITEPAPMLHIGQNGYDALADELARCYPDVTDESTNAMLHGAAKGQQVETARLLLARQADVNVRDEHNNTPLILAAQYNSLPMVQLLLRLNADKNLKNDQLQTALSWAEQHRNQLMVDWISTH
ncbi:GA-binding protein subunit beta-2-like [Bacillus rossius redtenbacheri]|uniref:GA-binding protein subunit beta-2-like n=1 Tax=Bacillus rossius redtenbacheri TaxID=93214 RepID=UPI002FDD9E2E